MAKTTEQINAAIAAHDEHVAEHGAYAVGDPPKPTKRQRKEPTLLDALAAGTKISFKAKFAGEMAALMTFDDLDVWARAALLSLPEPLKPWKGNDSPRRDKRPGDADSLVDTRGWLKAKAQQGRADMRMLRDLSVDALIALADDPAEAQRIADEHLAVMRRCVEAAAAAA